MCEKPENLTACVLGKSKHVCSAEIREITHILKYIYFIAFERIRCLKCTWANIAHVVRF